MNACVDVTTATDTPLTRFAADVREGLGRARGKSLPPLHLYDALGSALFEAITQLPEYGLWRAERRILAAHADAIAAAARADVVVELGSGSAAKTQPLLAALQRLRPVSYCAIDVSPAALAATAATLREPGLPIRLVEAEYDAGLAQALAGRSGDRRVLALFFGSSLGNFGRADALARLRHIRRSLHAGDALLIGADLLKPVPQLLAAYADSLGVTAAFNLNLLVRMNRELGADFELARFRHRTRFDADRHDVEMHIESLREQSVRFAALDFTVSLRSGETIHTESSHKYAEDELDALTAAAGFAPAGRWRDEEWPFVDALYRAI